MFEHKDKLYTVEEIIRKVSKLSKDETKLTTENKIKTPILRSLGSSLAGEFKGSDKDTIECLILAILRSNFKGNYTIAFEIMKRNKKLFLDENSEYIMIEIMNNHINDWVACDDFSTHSYAYWLEKNPSKVAHATKFAQSKNAMVRRACAVSFIYAAKKGMFISESLRSIEPILSDEHYLVQKAIGWLLKEHLKHGTMSKVVLKWCQEREHHLSNIVKTYCSYKEYTKRKKLFDVDRSKSFFL
ncbi:MAG: DNA alkylation repair protein [Desulfobacteraceae bacterium]|nr:DNA alkylation repair protein [Desulfobacteraceae bacterium]